MRVNDVVLNTCLPTKGLVICIDISLVYVVVMVVAQVRLLSAVSPSHHDNATKIRYMYITTTNNNTCYTARRLATTMCN